MITQATGKKIVTIKDTLLNAMEGERGRERGREGDRQTDRASQPDRVRSRNH